MDVALSSEYIPFVKPKGESGRLASARDGFKAMTLDLNLL